MDSSKGCFFLIGLLVSSTIFSSILLSLWAKPVFGEEFTQEQLTASLGTRSADLLIKMVPAIVTTDTLQFGQKPAMSGSNSSMSNSNSSMSNSNSSMSNSFPQPLMLVLMQHPFQLLKALRILALKNLTILHHLMLR